MPASLVALTVIAILAACGGPVPSPGPVASGTAQPASAKPAPIADAADAFVATVGQAADGATTNALVIEAVAPDGNRRLVASLTDVTAGLANGSRLLPAEPILVSPGGLLTVGVDVGVAGVEGDVERRLIFDLRDLHRPPFHVPSGPAAWGPDGRLAVVGGFETTFVDPARGEQVVAPIPQGPTVSTVWAAKASGLLAFRPGPNDRPIPGLFQPDGRFAEGTQKPYSTIGLGKPYGGAGTFINDDFPDGGDGSDHSLTEDSPGEDRPVVWLEVHARDSDPSILDHAWDSAGVGQWVLLGRDGVARLVHLPRPGALDERAVFEVTGQPRIVGVAPNDKAIVVAMYAADGAPPALLRIDPSTGAVVRIERADGLSYFAGWAAAP